jgi:hypothetical protein
VSFSYFIWYRVHADERETETVIRHMMARLAACRTLFAVEMFCADSRHTECFAQPDAGLVAAQCGI